MKIFEDNLKRRFLDKAIYHEKQEPFQHSRNLEKRKHQEACFKLILIFKRGSIHHGIHYKLS